MDPFHRYSRQTRLPQIGEEGQRKISQSSVVLLGCGALGSVIASLCARTGLGRIHLIDRDLVEIHNLQRQILYDEEDVSENLPKAVAAQKKLSKINSSIEIQATLADVTSQNILKLLEGSHLIFDGTDNFQTRFLLNDAAHKLALPWVYCGVISTYGHTMAILPGRTPCLRCYIPEPPPPGEGDTCEVVGVLGSAVQMIASLAFNEGLKILLGHQPTQGLTILETWNPSLRTLEVPKDPDCPCCSRGDFQYLDQSLAARGEAAVLCGNNAVQIRCSEISLEGLAQKLRSLGEVKVNSFVLKFSLEGKSLTAFSDGRVIVTGTSDPAEARSFFSKYVGM